MVSNKSGFHHVFFTAFHGFSRVMIRPAGRIRNSCKSRGSSWNGKESFEVSRAGSDPVGNFLKSHGSGRVGSGHPDPIRQVGRDPTRQKPWCFWTVMLGYLKSGAGGIGQSRRPFCPFGNALRHTRGRGNKRSGACLLLLGMEKTTPVRHEENYC